jgi:hypothetical integral membrane protein (TIGR02206 family)
VQAGQPEFESFGVQHAQTVLTVGGLIAGMCWMGRMLRGTTAGRRYEIALATCVWILWISYQVYDYVKYGFEPGNTLPLQMCDFSAVFAALVFVRPGRGLQSLAYFWGLALGSQAVITPDMAGGPGSIAFYWFWLYHVFIVGAGVYVVVVQGFRPQSSDLRFAVLMGVLYVAAIFTINAIFDLNYGYVGRATPTRPTLIDVLGPWPLRVVFMVLLGAVGMTLLWLPWVIAGSRPRRAPAA